MKKVFVVQEGPFDYTSAEDYGELVFCSYKELTPTRGGQYNESIIQGIKKAMANYVAGYDYILLSGSPVAIAHCLAAAFAAKRGEHLLLKWDNQKNAYMLYRVEF